MSVSRSQDSLLYKEAYEEARRLIRISDEIRISLKKVDRKEKAAGNKKAADKSGQDQEYSKLTTSKLAKQLGSKTKELNDALVEKGYLEAVNGKNELTEKGKKDAGGERKTGRFGAYFLWNADLTV